MRIRTRGIGLVALVAAVLSLVGCGDGTPPLGKVTGTVVSRGKPMAGVTVTFMPDPEKGNKDGRSSSGLTDDQGKFSLTYTGASSQPGAAVGWHKVTVEDTAAENYRPGEGGGQGGPPPKRVPQRYTSAKDTPLGYEVKAGEQNFEIEVK